MTAGRYVNTFFAVAASLCIERWSRLSEQNFRVDKWSLCRG